MRESRLQKSLERQSKQTLLLTTIGIIIILALLFTFAIPALIKFSLVVEKPKPTDSSQSTTQTSYVAPPVLDTPVSATNSASMTITGSADPNEQVQLFVNQKPVDEINTQSDGTFKFPNVTLQTGTNTITALAITNHGKSDQSSSISVTYSNSAPSLTISYPSDNQEFKDKDNPMVTITGTTDSNNTITVNGYDATVDGNGTFTYTLKLNNGDNHVTIDAVDPAGNKTEKTMTIKYNP